MKIDAMKTRKQIESRIAANLKRIADLKEANIRLRIESFLLSDKEQQYSESTETWGRGKHKREVLAGRIKWMQDFKDDDTGDVIWIEREHVVRIDGVWQIESVR